MSIVPISHVRIFGFQKDKARLLNRLQEFGKLEIIPFRSQDGVEFRGPTNDSRQALKFLLTTPQHRRQISDPNQFDAAAIEKQALELESQLYDLRYERDELKQRIEELEPFGEFAFASLEEMAGLKLWFYIVPNRETANLKETGFLNRAGEKLPWRIVSTSRQMSYVVVVSDQKPVEFVGERIETDTRSPEQLRNRLSEVEVAIENCMVERTRLTMWCRLFARSLDELEDAAARQRAAALTCDSDPIFAIEAWVPEEHVAELASDSAKNGFVCESRPPRRDENPPTLMRNTPRTEAGEDLVSFYMTPGYWTWDPSALVLISFAIFFAMILADAAYSLIILLALVFFWKRLGKSPTGLRFRPMLVLIAVASLIYGVLVGSYFGVTPAEGSLLSYVHVLDMNNSTMMMGLSILVGAVHVILANIMDARRHTNWTDRLCSLGWAVAIAGGLIFAASKIDEKFSALGAVGAAAMVLGLLCVVLYTAPHEKPHRRLFYGTLGLAKVSAAFGDILSYLRLFALGLASASLATAFNDMATGVREAVPSLGLFLALLILLFGHSLNMLLGVSSGVIHGLRLNVIEFFNWGLKEEGQTFAPFRRKDGSLWK
ncbi:V-type ATP synthase subunit I [Thalassoglobus neptunius]|uniref:V-type ATP synthase subunit I n=1 Tax=Thalassoglobus neptunius TaxID=1938619 RepID=A0A5C5X6E5_9PLAN|nr:ATPase V [Thalassoglobus neptunius]TWT58219.1 V-type ATP synthase subunit I [Thalassoglobus neptunius]